MSTMCQLWDLVGPLDDSGKPTGPLRTEVNTILAREAITRDPKRYTFNLPKGASPGPAEQERLARQAQLDGELKGDMPDPHFPTYSFGRQPQ